MEKIIFHNDTEPALDEDTLNDMQDNIENAINTCKIISTDETLCGMYKGKKLYRKLFETTTIAGYNQISLSSISNLDEIKDISGITKDTRDNNKLPLFYYNNQYDMCRAYYENANNNIIVQCGTNYGFGNAEIIVEYTKTN